MLMHRPSSGKIVITPTVVRAQPPLCHKRWLVVRGVEPIAGPSQLSSLPILVTHSSLKTARISSFESGLFHVMTSTTSRKGLGNVQQRQACRKVPGKV